MTEAQWLACTTHRDLLSQIERTATHRQLVLMACATCRLLTEYEQDVDVLVAEREAGRNDATEAEARLSRPIDRMWARVWDRHGELLRDWDAGTARLAAVCVLATDLIGWRYSGATRIGLIERGAALSAAAGSAVMAAWSSTHQRVCEIIRDVAGNPFRQASVNPEWLVGSGGLVVQLARGVYDERAFERLPILSDALEEAGCHDEAVLSHLREPGPHVRGCWALDLALGKS